MSDCWLDAASVRQSQIWFTAGGGLQSQSIYVQPKNTLQSAPCTESYLNLSDTGGVLPAVRYQCVWMQCGVGKITVIQLVWHKKHLANSQLLMCFLLQRWPLKSWNSLFQPQFSNTLPVLIKTPRNLPPTLNHIWICLALSLATSSSQTPMHKIHYVLIKVLLMQWGRGNLKKVEIHFLVQITFWICYLSDTNQQAVSNEATSENLEFAFQTITFLPILKVISILLVYILLYLIRCINWVILEMIEF